MFQQAGTAQLNDYFRPLSERGGSRVFFCRIAGYGETVAAFLRRYYEAARRSGVIIDGRIPNPTPDNLSYFNEMMGSGFQMDRDFLSQRLKKWLPRMTDGQRDAVVTAMYATLDDMRRAGKNDNMLRNAYMKYMCWLYYKFERIVNVLGGETLPKILYAGDVSHYELQLLTVLSRAGAGYRPAGVRRRPGISHRGPPVGPVAPVSGPWPGVLPGGLRCQAASGGAGAGGAPPAALRHAALPLSLHQRLVQKAELNAALTGCAGPRKRIPAFSATSSSASTAWRTISPIPTTSSRFISPSRAAAAGSAWSTETPRPPGRRRSAAVKRGNYASAEQLAAGLAANIRYPANVELQRLMTRAFIDLVLEEGERCGGSVSKLTSRAGVPPVLAEPVSEGPLSGLEGAGGGGLSPVWQMRVGHRSPVPAAAGPPAGGCPVAAPQSE